MVARGEADVVLHGHTHIPRDEVVSGVRFINPGHLKPDDKRGHQPSFAILEVKDKKISVELLEIQ